MKPTYFKCMNDECGFYLKQLKKKKWKNPHYARWNICIGHIEEPSWIRFRCKFCGWELRVNCDEVEELDINPKSLLKSFQELKRADT